MSIEEELKRLLEVSKRMVVDKSWPVSEEQLIKYHSSSFEFGFACGALWKGKELTLTCEDIKTIDKLLNQCVDYSNPYQEVLKRFKDMKKEPIKFKQGDVLYIPKRNIWVVWDEHKDIVICSKDFNLFIGHHFDSSITVEDVHVASEQQRSQLIQMLREKISITDEKTVFTDEIKSALKTIEK